MASNKDDAIGGPIQNPIQKGIRGVDTAADAAARAVESGVDRAQEALEHGMDAVRRGAQRTRQGVHTAAERAEQTVEQAGQRVAELREKTLSDFAADLSGVVRKHPGTAILVAGAVGFLLGAVLRRRA